MTTVQLLFGVVLFTSISQEEEADLEYENEEIERRKQIRGWIAEQMQKESAERRKEDEEKQKRLEVQVKLWEQDQQAKEEALTRLREGRGIDAVANRKAALQRKVWIYVLLLSKCGECWNFCSLWFFLA